MTLRTLNYGNYGIFLIMGNAGFCPSTVVNPKSPLKISFARAMVQGFTPGPTPRAHAPRTVAEGSELHSLAVKGCIKRKKQPSASEIRTAEKNVSSYGPK